MQAKIKILTVSRDPVLADYLQKELNDGQYEIINTRHTDIELKDVVNSESPAFILLDIMMPTLDGISTCLSLRQWTQTPIMMLSTWGAGSGTVRGLNLGSESYLTDPFGADVLKKRIAETLRRTTLVADQLSNFDMVKN